MAENDAFGHGIWQRGGADVEVLPDPFGRDATRPPHFPAGEPKPSKRRWLRWGFTAFGALLLITLLWLIVTAPLSRALEPLKDPAMLLLSQEGRPIARRGAVKDEPVEVAKLDPLTSAAFIAIEDRRFRSHWGIDPRAIGRAMVANARAGGVRQGGSTLTQQLAKTSFLSADRSLKRKAQEVIIAFWLEGWLTKDEILSRYLSSVYFGDGVYGLRAASRHYFDREPERLTLAQSAMLAGLVQAPSRLAPTRNLAAAQKRSRLVLQEMADNGYISQARAKATKSARPVGSNQAVPTGTYFADWVAPQAAQAFDADYGEVRVPTTLDADLQRLAVQAVSGARIGDAQAALVAMRPDGRVVAMVGGRDYGKSPFNRATQARRQPGSAFKLFVYLAALRAGYTPNSMIDDRPITVDGWSPGNNDGVYRGQITLREAFARSSNAATVRLAEQIGRQNVIRAARDLGIDSPLIDRPSLSLGTSGVSLIELTSAYAAIAGGRYPVEPTGLQPKSEDEEEGLSSFFARGGQLDDRRDRTPMLALLWAAANEGTGRRAALSTPTFGKTGTTQNNRDALFIGFAGNLVVGVWVGHDDDRTLGKITGGTAPAEIWRRFMAPAISIDGRRGPPLPAGYRVPERQRDRKSPLPDDWSEGGDAIRQIIEAVERLIEEN
ncbi:PBP1A family penicillin-binding protein [Sphingomonas sp. RB56-2]|uniref:peptidoglycan glycosyltransferase n=1 Tax=Sphingomonas brevis TaxID=2908206 RepID=A0ABT0S5Y2_9SPHN|nr:PBP1A family penicillin-binding protein [Sphingomonas brevis]MCL6739795.1 PBP1A family penicillin-binding protein [Sphingomonas brevis]